MKVISQANEGILQILSRFRRKSEKVRLLHYVVEEPVEDGVLLFNTLTRELVLLSPEEYRDLNRIDYLKESWFLVPEETNEKELADLVRWILSSRQKKSKHITAYTIFTTTDCNARCFYCFELGRTRIPMSRETAVKTAAYIAKSCGGKPVKLAWFGGEPLFNQEAMDTICAELQSAGVEYTSSVVSNGYLFDAQTAKRAAEFWNVKKVQITLDGTEAVYNKTKAYIYKNTNPYQIVLQNIENLLDNQISVSVRLNLDLYNAGDLLELVDELAVRFRERTGLRVYAHHIFQGNTPMAESHTHEEWEERDAALRALNERIRLHGLAGTGGISRHIRLNHCMADSGNAVTIGPEGDIGLCEHFSESEFIGHIDTDGFDQKAVDSWKQPSPELPECGSCFRYPECIHLKKCPNSPLCFPQERADKLRSVKFAMANELKRYLQNDQEETEEEDNC